MALIADGRSVSSLTAVENKTKGMRTVQVPRGAGYSTSATGLIPTQSAAGAALLVMRSNPSAGSVLCFIERFRLQMTTTTAFTAAYTAGRKLALFRGSGASAAGGVAISPPSQKDSTQTVSQVSQANGGDFRVTVGSALTTTGITFEANSIREVGVTHLGLAGSNYEVLWEFHPNENSPIILQPGQLLALRTTNAFDAGGVMQFTANIDWHESVAYGSTIID